MTRWNGELALHARQHSRCALTGAVKTEKAFLGEDDHCNRFSR
jgi:hypothetical protein